MKELKEPVAKRANAEDSVAGHFWAERFKSTRLLDEAAVLVCSIYVDLNMIRAGQAATPEDSRYTSAWHRIQSLLRANGTPMSPEGHAAYQRPEPSVADNEAESLQGAESPQAAVVSNSARADAWLALIPETGEEGNQTCPASRASDRGFLPVTVEQYLDLLDWTGRQIRGGASCIPDHLSPILERLGIVADQWEATIQTFDS